MSVSELSSSTQDYLKSIWALAEWTDRPVTSAQLAERLSLRPSTVSDAVRKLGAQGLVLHAPYGDIELTELGRRYAIAMVRRHRLIETFLVHTLGYRWDQVHDEAERLEHAVSDFMIDRIDELLQHPSRDPHGDPIPRPDGSIRSPRAVPLAEISAGSVVVVERISDESPEMLQFLEDRGITLDTRLHVEPGSPFSDAVGIRIEGATEAVVLGRSATEAIYVSLRDPGPAAA